MAEGCWLYQICDKCGGTGIDMVAGPVKDVAIEVVCPKCNGVKYIPWGIATKDDLPIPDNLPELP